MVEYTAHLRGIFLSGDGCPIHHHGDLISTSSSPDRNASWFGYTRRGADFFGNTWLNIKESGLTPPTTDHF
ncbi:hypothetical protein [Photobacterium sp. 1_MG-2023]|uniref:hypothetical protein n=1 Tax=Photobacterium sp. 1_MG-2023 TaxID=3062646 RepID=UPI0026E36900|nr:hypothetical protein [Photobacterium sp. 1_MG-2023]MDO6706612.1 hypothetical protein [Photobacterium sp. 1_MG-2023]